MSRVPIFQDLENEMWFEGLPLQPDSNILLTVSSISGERSAFISSRGMTEIHAGQLVDAAPAVQSTISNKRQLNIQYRINRKG